jgi:hypothetical protein
VVSDSVLRIRLTRVVLNPKVGTTRLNEVRGGPDALLNWLETQLGLIEPVIPKANRVTELASWLDGAGDAVFTQSLVMDRWATASQILDRRDELRMAGWNGHADDSLPKLISDLGQASDGRDSVFVDEAARLLRVLQAIADGQQLPPHRCVLEDWIELWPPMWRAVLGLLTVENATRCLPAGANGSALRAAQELVNAGEPRPIVQDTSFRFVTTRSEATACEFVAATLAKAPEALAETVVYCESDSVALRLDACLNRLGLPTMGAVAVSRSHPVLQVLPLCLSLCWEPVDPQVLLDFLTLPVNPIPHRVARPLIDSLVEQPGLGSARWEAAIAELCCPENDPDGKLRARLDAWLMCERVPRNEPISSAAIRARCGLVAQWAAGRALSLLADADPDLARLAEALQVAAGHASALGELVESQGQTLTEPQLGRLVEEATSTGVSVAPFMKAFGGPLRVRTLVEIDAPFRRLIWLGLGTADAQACPWPVAELEKINAAGIDLDDGSRALSALRSAEARGFSRIQEFLLGILLPHDLVQRWHPIWLAIRTMLEGRDEPTALDDLFARGDENAISPLVFEVAERSIIPPPKRRLLWHVSSDLLQDRNRVSASELQDRLGCPLKWVFTYQARLRPGSIAQLPGDFQLKGTFCHSVLERLFGNGGELPSNEEATALAGQIFDERLPLDAAPLAQPDQVLERHKLRTELINATRALMAALSSGGYRITGIEVEVEGDAFAKPLTGWIDCLAVRDDAHEAVIDFKYSGQKYRKLIADGRAVQLATYAHSRTEGGRPYPAVAYLVLADAQLYTPSGSPLSGDATRHVVDGPAIGVVWDRFSQAVTAADGWLTGEQPIPARPLQPPAEWPKGVGLVLDGTLAADQPQEPCRYCKFGVLCGREGLQ